LPASVQIVDGRLQLEPLLLNSGDSITIKILLSDAEDISLTGRVQGVKEIVKVDSENKVPLFPLVSAVVDLIVGLCSLLIGLLLLSILLFAESSLALIVFSISNISIGIMLVGYSVKAWIKKRKLAM
jgi:hypothetical protein